MSNLQFSSDELYREDHDSENFFTAALLSWKHYFQQSACPDPNCISDFLCVLGWEREQDVLFLMDTLGTATLCIAQCTVTPIHSHLVQGTPSEISTRSFCYNHLSSLGSGHRAQASLSLSQGGGPSSEVKWVLDNLTLFLRIFPRSPLYLINSTLKHCHKHLLIVGYLWICLSELYFLYSLIERTGF